jgi:hypothetical protein
MDTSLIESKAPTNRMSAAAILATPNSTTGQQQQQPRTSGTEGDDDSAAMASARNAHKASDGSAPAGSVDGVRAMDLSA